LDDLGSPIPDGFFLDDNEARTAMSPGGGWIHRKRNEVDSSLHTVMAQAAVPVLILRTGSIPEPKTKVAALSLTSY
jgi:hypothetical protein